MRIVFALLGTPALILTAISMLYALVPSACATGDTGWLSTLTSATLALSCVAALLAARRWRTLVGSKIKDDSVAGIAGFLSFCTACIASLCAVTAVALWIPQWVLSPCA